MFLKQVPSKKLSTATGCSIKVLKKIVNKGQGAYYSSGSRPNQTPQSWGYARLASSLTAGKAATVDVNIINNDQCYKKKYPGKLLRARITRSYAKSNE